MLITLKNRDDKLKMTELNKIRKPGLEAGLGFNEGMKYAEAKKHYKGVRFEELRAQIVAKYNNNIPRECNDCKYIFNNGDMTVKLTYCFMCDMKICPRCVPAQSSPPSGYVPICGVCRSSYGNERHVERMTALLEQNHAEANTTMNKESFLDVTVRSKKSSTPKKKDENPKEEKPRGVCSHYLKGRCKHGRLGKECLWQHPNLCFSFTKTGDCKKESCEYFHPKLCRHSERKEVCEN